jgi:hypothetical protein
MPYRLDESTGLIDYDQVLFLLISYKFTSSAYSDTLVTFTDGSSVPPLFFARKKLLSRIYLLCGMSLSMVKLF